MTKPRLRVGFVMPSRRRVQNKGQICRRGVSGSAPKRGLERILGNRSFCDQSQGEFKGTNQKGRMSDIRSF